MQKPLNDVWNETLRVLERELDKPAFHTWLRNTKPLAFYDGTVIVGVPHEFARDWLSSRYAPALQRAIEGVTGSKINLRFTIPSDNSHFPEPSSPDIPPAQPAYNGDTIFRPLNPKYTFDSFVVGNGNRFAHAAALAVAEAPARAYNPLFIYGGVGLGKTHLMHAIGQHVLHHSPFMRVLYVSSETFTNELINSIRDDRAVEFRNKYRNIDVLLIDDIQFLAGKERTQEEFFHTFNALHEANRQLVISSDRPPKEIPTLEERLRSRFEGGLISDIQPPDLETRVAILHKKARMENLEVPTEIMLFIASRIETNIRELEGALIRLIAYSSLKMVPLTIEAAMEALKDVLPPQRPKQITIKLIQEVVSQHYGLRIDDFKARKRTRSISFPRQVAMYLSRELTDASLPKIGEEFGGRDHTTVLHAIEKITQDMENDPSLKSTIKELMEKIRCE